MATKKKKVVEKVIEKAPVEEVKGKYADTAYEKDGSTYGKTDSGKEVEISGENMQKLLEQYQKAQEGNDSKTEQELLDQLQVILDNAETLQE